MERNYRRCSAIFLLMDGFVFAGERSDIPGEWQIPQGGVDDLEGYFEAAVRELYEETGVESIKFIKCTRGVYKYDFPENIRKYRNCMGQQVKFFVFEFTGSDSEINLQTSSTREFSAWKWMSPSDLLYSVVEFKKEALSGAMRELALEA